MIFGDLTGTFSSFSQGTSDPSSFSSDLSRSTLNFVYLAIGEYVTIYIATVGWIYVGEHISRSIREQYLAAILRQNIGFFDKLGAGEITTRITSDTSQVQDGMSEKVALTMTAVSTFLAAFIIGFVKSWKLTLILASSVIAISLAMGLGSSFMVKYNKKTLESYALGGTVVEEVFSSVRNATAFGTQDKLARKYEIHLTEAERWGIRMRFALSCMVGAMFCVVYLNYVGATSSSLNVEIALY